MTALALGLLLGLLARPAASLETWEAPPATALRLDDELVMLTAFRHAAGLSDAAWYRRGPYGRWMRDSWFVLDWAAAVGPWEEPPPAEAPIMSAPSVHAGEPCLDRVTRQRTEPGFPFTIAAAPWMAHPVEPGLTIARRYWPAGLTGISADYLQVLWLLGACGRGGACSLGVAFPAEPYVAITTAMRPPLPEAPVWPCRPRPVRVMGHGGEREVFTPQRCDGSVPPGVLETLSILARPQGVPRPTSTPDRPSPEASRGELLPGLRLLHPRLLWVLHRIAAAFPWREVYIYSGYRPAPSPTKPGSHRSQHHDGRALDLSVRGVSNEDLLALCWELRGVSCGFYPNNKFVHIDVRPREQGNGVWVDTSAPGEPSHYVASWPGVVEGGTVVHERAREPQP